MSPRTTIVLALAAGFVGGTISQRIVPVHAQDQPSVPQEIRAHKFVLVDESGVDRGVFGFGNRGADIEFMDRKNHTWTVQGINTVLFDNPHLLPDATCQVCALKHAKKPTQTP